MAEKSRRETKRGKWASIDLGEFLPDVLSPPDYTGIPPFRPRGHYVTSGDAVRKTEQLLRDLEALRMELLIHPPNSRIVKFGRELGEVVGRMGRMLEVFLALRGTHIHLETDWRDGKFCVCGKSPRGIIPKKDHCKTGKRQSERVCLTPHCADA